MLCRRRIWLVPKGNYSQRLAACDLVSGDVFDVTVNDTECRGAKKNGNVALIVQHVIQFFKVVYMEYCVVIVR